MRRYFFKSLLIVALVLMSKPALAAPTAEQIDWMILRALFILIGGPWFLISAFRAFKKNRSNLISLHVSSLFILFVFLKELNDDFNSDFNFFNQSEDFYWPIGIVLTILTINILAVYKLIKRRQEKELEEQIP